MNLVRPRRNTASRYRIWTLHAAVLLACLCVKSICFAQEANSTPAAQAGGPKSDQDKPLTQSEREELLKLIRSLQERIDKLEGAQATTASTSLKPTTTAPVPTREQVSDTERKEPDVVSPTGGTESTPQDKSEDKNFDGRYTPNLGFRLANTEWGDLNVSIYTYVRYLNQKGLDPSYQDAFGNTKSVQQRQDIQLLKLQIKFLGWILNPKLRYFLYAWTSNANQGQEAQLVLAGNLQYTFNKYFTLGGGIRSLPGTRSVEGNFPFWMNVDSRMIADEFMRPSYTSGIWATGEITDRLW